jgi:predicted transcriptional regulator
MKGNIEAVNLYAIDMIKEKNFQNIPVANDKDVVISLTNKKLEGKKFESAENSISVKSDSTVINKAENGSIQVYTPIIGFNKKIGAIFF